MFRQLVMVVSLLLAMFCSSSMVWAGTVAQAGSWSLSQEEVDKKLSAKLYELREEKIQEIVLDHLLKQEAEKLKIDPDQVINHYLKGKISQPSPEEVKAYIQANHERLRLPNKGEGMEDKIAEYMQNKQMQTIASAHLKSLWKKYGVKISLTPPRFEVGGSMELSKGRLDAPITIIEFSDFECPYCRRAQPTLESLAKTYGDKIRFVFRHYPLPFHKKAPKASEASQCAHDQGQFWPFHDALFVQGAGLEIADLKKLAADLKLDQKRFDHCLDSNKYAQMVSQDTAEGKRLGITGTPTFFVNGVRLVGAVPLNNFVKVIESELNR